MPIANYQPNSVSRIEAESIELRSEDVQEIFGQMPNWTIRWGISIIFGIVGVLLLASWLVKYPDTLVSRAVITTQIPPVSMIARTEGRIQFYIKNNQHIYRGQYLAILENPANAQHVKHLSEKLSDLRKNLNTTDQSLLATLSFRENLNLGELQSPYIQLLISLKEYKRSRDLALHVKQIRSLQLRIQQYEKLTKQLEKQQILMAEEVELTRKRYFIDAQLLEEKVIADADFDRIKNTFLQAKRSFETTQSNIISNQILISQLESQITELQTNHIETEEKLHTAVEMAYKQLESQLEIWEQRYILKSPINGKVAFTKYWSNNQFITAGEEMLTIIPVSQALFAQVQVPIKGSGKVEVGQSVNIKFDNYPSHEFGIVRGVVQSISLIPRNDQYTIQISLPKGLRTSYKKNLTFQQEMQGTAEIITKDLRLIERVFNQFRALLNA